MLEKNYSYKLSKYVETVAFNDNKSGTSGVLIYSTRTEQMRIVGLEDWNLIQGANFFYVNDKIIADLSDIKILVPTGQNEFDEILRENTEYDEYDKGLHFTIMVTANCSFGCDYCGQKHSSRLLGQEDQYLIIQRIEEKLKIKKFEKLNIVWFGGEPLLGFSVIDALSPKLQRIAIDFDLKYQATITTNGYHLSEESVDKLVNHHKISKFYITLDGVGNIHDKRRCLKTKAPTFYKIYENLKMLVSCVKNSQKDVGIVIRCNVDKRNEDSVLDLIHKFKSDGFEKYIVMQIAAVHPWGNDISEIEMERTRFASVEVALLAELFQLGFKVFCLPKRRYGMCLATSKYSEAFDPYGDVFPCSEVGLVPTYIKNEENIYKIDNLKNRFNAAVYLTKRKNFIKKYLEAQEKTTSDCKNCNIYPTCLGMCPKQWNDNIKPCPSAKYNLKERLLLHYIMERNKI